MQRSLTVMTRHFCYFLLPLFSPAFFPFSPPPISRTNSQKTYTGAYSCKSDRPDQIVVKNIKEGYQQGTPNSPDAGTTIHLNMITHF
jgi:hypothetical protein